MKGYHVAVFFGLILVGLYAWYDNATYAGPSGPVKYKGSCSFADWITRKCSTQYSNSAGIGVS